MSTFDTPLTILRPAEVRFGAGSLSGVTEWITRRGPERVLIVADAFNAGRLDQLGLAAPAVFGNVQPEPGLADLEAAVAAAEAVGADAVIGFGGGSAMDLAKLVAVLAGTGKRLDEISGPGRAPERKVALVQVPTTAGTGSEVGTRALVTDPRTRNKIATESIHMLADLAVIDPDLAVTAPPFVTAATGIDAMAHCVEALSSRRSHPIIDDYAMQGVRLVGRHLRRAVENGEDREARAALAYAAYCGGICLGPVNTTAGHALSYPLGTRYKIPHGTANALIFPHTFAANAGAMPEKTAAVCAALGGGSEPFATANAFCEGLGLDMRLSNYGVEAHALRAMAEEAHAIRRLLDWNPRDLSVEDILTIYEAAF